MTKVLENGSKKIIRWIFFWTGFNIKKTQKLEILVGEVLALDYVFLFVENI